MSTSSVPTVLSIVERLQKLPSSKWYLDARHLAELLDISVGHLDSFLKCIASGGVGKKSDDSWIPNPAPYNTPIEVMIIYSTYTVLTLDANQMLQKKYQNPPALLLKRSAHLLG